MTSASRTPVPVWRIRVRRWLALLLPGLLVACGGQSCTSCAGPLPPPQSPQALLLPQTAQVRVTQHGFDVIANHMIGLIQALFGSAPGGMAVVDVKKLLGPAPLQFSGGLGLFQGTAGARDLVLTLDLAAMSIQLVEGSNPARIRLAFDHARIGAQQGVVFGAASFAGIQSDAACHLLNGLQVGTPTPHLATLSAQLDVVLGVDAAGKLQVGVDVQQPILHEVGFSLGKDCGLAECTDKVLLEDPCLECELCATGQLGSDALNSLKNLLGPLMTQLMTQLGNLLVQQTLKSAINGKPLDLEVPIDVPTLLQKASPLLAGLLGEPAGPLLVRIRPSANGFDVAGGALRARLDASAFAVQNPCAVDPGLDATGVFAKLPQGAPPELPAQMLAIGADGKTLLRAVDVALLLSGAAIEEAVWSALRTGLLCIHVDSDQLYQISGGKLLVSIGALDVAMPGVRHLATAGAPLRIAIVPSARPEHAPLVHLAQEPTSTGLSLSIQSLAVSVEARVDGRWLTLAELRADVELKAGLQVVGEKLALSVRSAQVPQIDVVGDPIAPYADWKSLAPAVAQLAVTLLLAQPLRFDVDVQSALAQVLTLPIQAELVGAQAGGAQSDWLLLGISLNEPGGKP